MVYPGIPDQYKGIIGLPYSQLYPHPFLDPATLMVPNNIKQIFKLTRYFYMTHPVIAAAVYKLAEYPITDIVYNTSDEKLKKIYQEIIEDHMELKRKLVEIGIDFNVYGIVFLTVLRPFKRTFKGKMTGKEYTPEVTKDGPNWYRKDGKLYFKPTHEEVEIIDTPIHSYEFRLVRWDPMQIEIDYDEFSDQADYYYTISQKAARKFASSPLWLLTTPKPFLQAWLDGKSAIKFNKNSLIVIKRPSPSMAFKGWGLPLLVHVLQTLHYQQMLRRAQYAIAKDRTLPYRYIAPPPEVVSAQSPFTLNLADWKTKIEEALQIWKYNPNYIGIFPVPVTAGAITGEGKSLMLFPEINALTEEIIQGLQVPIEFIRGGLQWSGTSVSLRMLENHFLNYRQGLKKLLRNIVKVISAALEIEPIEIYLLPFKMADDIQRKQLIQALYQLQAVSKHTLLDTFELDYDKELEKLKDELKDAIELQQQQMIAQAQGQQLAQQLAAPDYEDFLAPENVPLGQQANLIMRQDTEGLIPPPQVNMQPLPEKNPPRRKESPV